MRTPTSWRTRPWMPSRKGRRKKAKGKSEVLSFCFLPFAFCLLTSACRLPFVQAFDERVHRHGELRRRRLVAEDHARPASNANGNARSSRERQRPSGDGV